MSCQLSRIPVVRWVMIQSWCKEGSGIQFRHLSWTLPSRVFLVCSCLVSGGHPSQQPPISCLLHVQTQGEMTILSGHNAFKSNCALVATPSSAHKQPRSFETSIDQTSNDRIQATTQKTIAAGGPTDAQTFLSRKLVAFVVVSFAFWAWRHHVIGKLVGCTSSGFWFSTSVANHQVREVRCWRWRWNSLTGTEMLSAFEILKFSGVSVIKWFAQLLTLQRMRWFRIRR